MREIREVVGKCVVTPENQAMELPRIVLKFGGTSVADASRVRAAGDIVESRLDKRPAVVVSAAAGVTDALLEFLELASVGDQSVLPGLDQLADRHRTLLRELALPENSLDAKLGELQDLLRGILLLREVTRRTRDQVLSYGEQLLAPIFAGHLEQRGVASRAWVAGDLGLRTDDRHGRARPLPEAYEGISRCLTDAAPHVPVLTGFLGRNQSGHTTTLGRGGSDYSASILARAVCADELEIWTDVDGILTADPRLVPDAQVLPTLSFGEASELAYSGARVLHPSTITPAMEAGIAVRVLNTHQSARPGTLILGDPDPADVAHVRSIAHKTGVQVVTIVSPRMLDRHGFISRIADVFDRHGVSIDMISTSEVSVSLTTDEAIEELGPLLQELREFSTVSTEPGRGMVSVVGAGLGASSHAIGHILQTVASSGTEVEMVSYGATRLNFSFLIDETRVPGVVRALHARYFSGAGRPGE